MRGFSGDAVQGGVEFGAPRSAEKDHGGAVQNRPAGASGDCPMCYPRRTD